MQVASALLMVARVRVSLVLTGMEALSSCSAPLRDTLFGGLRQGMVEFIPFDYERRRFVWVVLFSDVQVAKEFRQELLDQVPVASFSLL